MEHPSPEPQTTERPSPTPPSAQTVPRLSSSTFSPLVSLFDNSTFSLKQVQPEAPRNPNPTPPQLINETANASESSCLQDSVFLEEENVHVGLLFASKALIQLLVNPFVGPLTNRYPGVVGPNHCRASLTAEPRMSLPKHVTFCLQGRLSHPHVCRLHHHVCVHHQ
uniref:Uncharacterized protein n=1 Tax=Oryzias sinensis TaxID=183150 RepID=A0A8C7WTL6_9TELE